MAGDIVICGKTDIYDAFFQAAGVAGIENAQWLQPDIARQREMAGYGRNDFIMIVRQHLLSSQEDFSERLLISSLRQT